MSLFALVHPRFAAAFLYAAYADGAAYAAGCLRLPTSIVSWHSPLQYICRALIQGFLSLLPFSPLEALLIHATHASLGILSGSSSGAHSFLHRSFILALLHTDFRLSLSCISQLLLFFSLDSMSWFVHRNIFSPILTPIHSLFI